MQAEQILPVVIIAGIIYLIKIGALSAVILALGRLWKKLTQKGGE